MIEWLYMFDIFFCLLFLFLEKSYNHLKLLPRAGRSLVQRTST